VPDAGSADLDSDDSKDVSARVFLTPFARGDGVLKELGFGLSGSTGEAEGSPTSPGLPVWRTSGQQGFFAYRTSSVPSEVAFADGERTRISPQAYFYRGPFGLLAELVASSHEVRRGPDFAKLEHEAWQLAAYWVFGGKSSYRGVVPTEVFDPAQGTWGAFELAARVAALDMDEDTFPSFANPATSASGVEQWTIGINWYLNRNLKLNLNYENFEFEGGAADGDRPAERVILARLQIAF
jgi:phosphate-selective porin OprO/OprP